jgi:hypothetical protein
MLCSPVDSSLSDTRHVGVKPRGFSALQRFTRAQRHHRARRAARVGAQQLTDDEPKRAQKQLEVDSKSRFVRGDPEGSGEGEIGETVHHTVNSPQKSLVK